MKDFFTINLAQFSVFSFLGLFTFGTLMYGFLWLFKHYIILLIIQSPVRRKIILDKLPAVNTLIWIFFAIYTLYFFIKPFPFLGVLLTLAAIYFGKGYLINLVHGLFFRLKGNIKQGQEIAFDTFQGTILKLNNFDFELQNKEGEIIQITYSTIVNEQIIKLDFSADFSSYKFSLRTNALTTEKKIRNILLQSPWITPVFPSSIKKIETTEGIITYDIIVYAIDQKYHSVIESDLKNKIMS